MTAAQLQAAALQAALPGYVVTVVPHFGDKPRFEVVSTDGGPGLYCLITDDASEIWRELRDR